VPLPLTMTTRSVSEKPILYKVFPLTIPQRRVFVLACLLSGDAVMLGFAIWLAYWLRFDEMVYRASLWPKVYIWQAAGMIPIWLFIFASLQLYHPRILFGGIEEYTRVFSGVTTGVVVLVVLDFLLHTENVVSRGWLILTWLFALTFVWLFRFAFRQIIYLLRWRGHLLSPALIVGANDEGCALGEQLQNSRASGLYIVGFVDDNYPHRKPICDKYFVLGKVADLNAIIQAHQVEEVIIAPTAVGREKLLGIFHSLNARPNVNLRLSSGLFEILTTGLRVKEFASVPLIEVQKTRLTGEEAFIKRTIDYLLAIPCLILLSPFFLLIAALIHLDSTGPVFFRRRVMGVNGREFDALKFRTMHQDGEKILEAYPELKEQLSKEHKLKDDPRLTRLGRFLRRYSLDELPQLFNVLFGQMSIVGPRMISPAEMDKYGKWDMNLLTVRPGITGLWQVSGRSDLTYEDRVRLDMYYIRNWSIWLDIYLLLATFPAVISKKGAY